MSGALQVQATIAIHYWAKLMLFFYECFKVVKMTAVNKIPGGLKGNNHDPLSGSCLRSNKTPRLYCWQISLQTTVDKNLAAMFKSLHELFNCLFTFEKESSWHSLLWKRKHWNVLYVFRDVLWFVDVFCTSGTPYCSHQEPKSKVRPMDKWMIWPSGRDR